MPRNMYIRTSSYCRLFQGPAHSLFPVCQAAGKSPPARDSIGTWPAAALPGLLGCIDGSKAAVGVELREKAVAGSDSVISAVGLGESKPSASGPCYIAHLISASVILTNLSKRFLWACSNTSGTCIACSCRPRLHRCDGDLVGASKLCRPCMRLGICDDVVFFVSEIEPKHPAEDWASWNRSRAARSAC